MIDYRPGIFSVVGEERKSQDEKWGANRDLDDRTWAVVLMEEVGEVANSILEYDDEELFTELVQVAAVAVAWMENILKREDENGGFGNE